MKKKSKITNILLGLAVVLVVFLIVVALQPAQYSVSRSINVAAPPEAIFPHVNELKKWEPWNPFAKLDPAIKMTYEGQPAGVGATYSWVGNSQVGEGRMTITESRPNELVRLKLEFFKPMAGVSIAEFTFKPQGDQTTVTWSMSGEKNFVSKAVCLFMSMDKMIGGQFEKGLSDLKLAAEGKAVPQK